MAWAMKWLAPGTTSRRLSAGSAQLRSDSIATVIAWASASWLRRRIRWETMPGANCLRAVTTSHIESPHRPLSWRRSATSATACWPRSDWLRASKYTVVPRQTESAAGCGMSEANQRIQPSVIDVTPCFVAPRAPAASPKRDHGSGDHERHGEWAHPAWPDAREQSRQEGQRLFGALVPRIGRAGWARVRSSPGWHGQPTAARTLMAGFRTGTEWRRLTCGAF